MEEITKKAIRFTDLDGNIEREEMLEDLYLADTALVNLGSSEEPKYKLKHRIRFSSMNIYEVSKEEAEKYVKENDKPHIYDTPYSELYTGGVDMVELDLI